jgi:hypothetical protein
MLLTPLCGMRTGTRIAGYEDSVPSGPILLEDLFSNHLGVAYFWMDRQQNNHGKIDGLHGDHQETTKTDSFVGSWMILVTISCE